MPEERDSKGATLDQHISLNLRTGTQPFEFFATAAERCTMKVYLRVDPNVCSSGVGNWERLNQISCGQSLFSSMTLKNFFRIRMRVRVAQHMWKIMAAENSH